MTLTPELVAAIGLILVQLYGMYLSHKGRARAEAAVKENTAITETVLVNQAAAHDQVNNRMDQLIDKTDKAGQLAGRAAEKAETVAEALASKSSAPTP